MKKQRPPPMQTGSHPGSPPLSAPSSPLSSGSPPASPPARRHHRLDFPDRASLQISAAGRNWYGQCGVDIGSCGADLLAPHPATGLVLPDGDTVCKLVCGEAHTMQLTHQGRVFAAGSNRRCELGSPPDSAVHGTLVPLLWLPRAAVDIAAGASHSVAILDNGLVYTWGSNYWGQCGQANDKAGVCLPGLVREFVAERAFAGGKCTFFITDEGEVYACGENSRGELCLNTGGAPVRAPQHVKPLSRGTLGGQTLLELQIGGHGGRPDDWDGHHCMALLSGGGVLVWGALNGRLADGKARWSAEEGAVPIRLSIGGHPARFIAAGAEHCAVVDGVGALWLWGSGGCGRLGSGDGADIEQPKELDKPCWRGPASAVVCNRGATFVRAENGSWFASGSGVCGVPLGVMDNLDEFRELPQLPYDCEVITGPSARHVFFLWGLSAPALALPRLASGIWLRRGSEGAALAGALACISVLAIALPIAQDACLAVVRALRGVEAAAELLLEVDPAADESRDSPQASMGPATPLGKRCWGSFGSLVMADMRKRRVLSDDGDNEEDVDEHCMPSSPHGLAQDPRHGIALSVFSQRAKEQVSEEYGWIRVELDTGTVVELAPVDAVSDLLDRAPDPGMELGEIAVVISVFDDVGRPEVRLRRMPKGDAPRSALNVPVDALWLREEPQMTQWMRSFAVRWAEEFDNADFRAEDIACPDAFHANRARSGRARCCIQRSLLAVVRRMLEQLRPKGGAAAKPGAPQWRRPVEGFAEDWGRTALMEGIIAAHVFTAEVMNPRTRRKRDTQMYAVLNAAMRQNWDEQMSENTDASRRLRHFAPLILHLDTFTSGMAKRMEHDIVYRGIGSLVAQEYQAGSAFVWNCFSSTTEKADLAQRFATGGVGTLFVIRERSAASIAMCSAYVSEAERVLPPARFTVLARMPESLLCVAETRSDIVIAEEQVDGAPLDRAAQAVRVRLKAHRCSSFIYKMFAGRFVEPRLMVHGPGEQGAAMRPLFQYFRYEGCRARFNLLRGGAGTGKTSILLALLHDMVQRHDKDAEDDDLETPLFLHCPWAAGLLTEELPVRLPLVKSAAGSREAAAPEMQVGPLVAAMCASLCVSSPAELEELRRQRLVVLLDSLDECPTSEDHPPGELLKKVPLLLRGGVRSADWPNTRFIACARKDFLQQHQITPRMLDDDAVCVCDVQPFNTVEQQLYVHKLAIQEVDLLVDRFASKDAAVRRAAVENMRCVPCSDAAAEELRAAAKQRIHAEVQSKGQDSPKLLQAVHAAKEALREKRQAAIRQCEVGVRQVLTSLKPDILNTPFILFQACTASRRLAELVAELQESTRYRIYDAWLRQDQEERIARFPELGAVVPPSPDRSDRLLDACSALAVGMYAQGIWHSSVGGCCELLGGDHARALLSVLPLRIESAKRDECHVSWRHRTLQEFGVARALLRADRTPAAVWEQALRGPLSATPEVCRFFEEGWRILDPAAQRDLRRLLGMLPGVRNAAVLQDAIARHQEPAPRPDAPPPASPGASRASPAAPAPPIQGDDVALWRSLWQRIGELDALTKQQAAELAEQGCRIAEQGLVISRQDVLIAKQDAELARLARQRHAPPCAAPGPSPAPARPSL